MTINGALNNAMSGLRAAGRASEIVSANLANALTPGYGKRMLELSSERIGDSGGVRVSGVVRDVNSALLSDKRMASASFGHRTATAGFLNRLEDLLGTPDNPASLSARLADLGSSLITASSRPDAPERLEGAVNSARDLASAITNASEGVQQSRQRADRSISDQVQRLNDALQELQELNGMITAAKVRGNDDAALRDHRQNLMDEVSEMIPVRALPRDNGAIALYSSGGAALLDGSASVVEFTKSNAVTPHMSVGGGTLSSLTINGFEVSTDSETGAIRGGTLGAQFEIRDEMAPRAQVQLDAFARDLVERFQDPGVDPTLGVGDAGLFTDNGASFDPLNEVGLSERLQINAAVDSRQGGEAWRIRDGIGAVVPGNSGNASILQSLDDALDTARTPGSGNFGTGSFDAAGLMSTMMSFLTSSRANEEQHLTFASTQFQELTEMQLADGVDSDEELRRLILIEQAYAANARIIETVDEMMQTILRL